MGEVRRSPWKRGSGRVRITTGFRVYPELIEDCKKLGINRHAVCEDALIKAIAKKRP